MRHSTVMKRSLDEQLFCIRQYVTTYILLSNFFFLRPVTVPATTATCPLSQGAKTQVLKTHSSNPIPVLAPGGLQASTRSHSQSSLVSHGPTVGSDSGSDSGSACRTQAQTQTQTHGHRDDSDQAAHGAWHEKNKWVWVWVWKSESESESECNSTQPFRLCDTTGSIYLQSLHQGEGPNESWLRKISPTRHKRINA